MQNYEELSFEALQELRNNLEAQAIKLSNEIERLVELTTNIVDLS
mgnify:CR=1 FL=1